LEIPRLQYGHVGFKTFNHVLQHMGQLRRATDDGLAPNWSCLGCDLRDIALGNFSSIALANSFSIALANSFAIALANSFSIALANCFAIAHSD
jgi:hypothetical protein